MTRSRISTTVGGVVAAGAIAVGAMVAGAGTASAAPTYIGPVYYELVGGIFPSPSCQESAAAERAAGSVILVDCVQANILGPQRGFSLTPYQLRVGIAPLGGS